MISRITWMNRDGRLLPLPLPTYSVAYAVYEDPQGNLHCFFALKQPGDHSPYDDLNRAREEAAGLPWAPVPSIGARGHDRGAASKYSTYVMKRSPKGDGYLIDGTLDVGSAFFSTGGTNALLGNPLDKLTGLLAEIGLGPKKKEEKPAA